MREYQSRVEERLDRWRREKFASRLWDKDPTLWFADPQPEITDRLGWLNLPETMQPQMEGLKRFAEAARNEGILHGVLLGMGGSSLAPELFQHTFGNQPGYPELIVLDSTHPAAVRSVEARVDLRRTLFFVSSKSGTTTETLSFFRYFWHKARSVTDQPGRRFVAITDPGTALGKLAGGRSFRHVFEAPADIGGRYSALAVFGLVPAALIGVEVERILDRARTMLKACCFSTPESENPCLALGAALAELALAGRDKVTFIASPSLEALPVWIEQLIAESTGKQGKGIIPVVNEPLASPAAYGPDRFFVHFSMEGDEPDTESQVAALEAAHHPVARIRLEGKADVGQEFFRWEVAVAAAGAALGIHPFNQPDVQLAKDLAQQAMKKGVGGAKSSSTAGVEEVAATDLQSLRRVISPWLDEVRPGDYVALEAYLAPTSELTALLQQVRVVLRDRLKVPTTLGYGPRFLHSTGQLHKGGPNTALILQLVDDPQQDLAVPEADYTFDSLIQAQALGDYRALKQRGRRTRRVNLGRDVEGGLARLAEVLTMVST
jgi:transaldolase/glucose-6-phosphate isomerase